MMQTVRYETFGLQTIAGPSVDFKGIQWSHKDLYVIDLSPLITRICLEFLSSPSK